MPLALVVAPTDPRTGDAASRREALAWIRGQLARHGFDIVIVGGGQSPAAAIERCAPTISPGDVVLVHVSGHLAGDAALAFGPSDSLPLQTMAGVFSARGPASLSFVVELTYDEDPQNPFAADERLGAVTRAFGALGRNVALLAAVRSASTPAERLAFTRAVLAPPPAGASALTVDELLADMHRRADTSLEAQRCATRMAFVAPGPTLMRAVEAAGAPGSPSAGAGAVNDADARIAEATRAGDWATVVELRLDRLPAYEEPRSRVRELVAIARILQAELGDGEGAITVLEQARELEPTRGSVLRALRRGYEALERWESAIEVTGVLANLAESASDRASYRAAQARIALERLGNREMAVVCLRAASEDDPRHPDVVAMAHELREVVPGLGAPAADPLATASVASVASGAANGLAAAAAFGAAYEAYRREHSADGASLAAQCLLEIGVANDEQRGLVEQFRSVGPVRARATLDASAWGLLRAPGFDEVLAALFAAVGPSAIEARLEELREARRLPTLDRERRLSETSTASVVRSFQWAARFLDVRCPDLYAIDDAPGIAVMHSPEPSTALGRSVLSGPSAKDLAFLAGRHLTYYRPEYHALVYYPTREDLTALLFAAVQLAVPKAPHPPAPALQPLRESLARRMGDRDRALLMAAVRKLNARGGQVKVGAWMRSVELTAARAGLLLCGDLANAATIVRSESRAIADLTTDERREDLIAFCASKAHVALRARYVVAAGDSYAPPGASPSAWPPNAAAQ